MTAAAPAPAGPARIIVLPPHASWERWTGRAPHDTEDRELPYRILATRGFGYRRIDTGRLPWNPFAKAHPILRALDPLRALRVLLFERGPTIVLCSFESSALVLLLLRRLFRSRLKVVVCDVGVVGSWRLRRLILDLVVPRADALLPLGANQAAIITERWHPPGLVLPQHMSIDCDFYAAAPDCPAGPVLAIGDDISRDYDTLLAAAQGIDHPVAIRTRLLDQEQVSGHVHVLTTPLTPLGYRDLIAAATIVVLPLHPTAHAGGVSALVQAMASGKAVVVSASEGVADYVRDRETCLVVPCHDPAALRAAILRLLADAALRRSLGAAARAHMLRHGSLPVEADFLQSVISRLSDPAPTKG